MSKFCLLFVVTSMIFSVGSAECAPAPKHASKLAPATGTCTWPGPKATSFPCSEFRCNDDDTTLMLNMSTWRDAGVPHNSKYLQYLQDASTDAMTMFDSFMDYWRHPTLNVWFYVVNPGLSNEAGDLVQSLHNFTEFYSIRNSNLCMIEITVGRETSNTADEDVIRFKRTVARELYHCVQFRASLLALKYFEGDEDKYLPSRWWVEGKAEYFADRLYPVSNSAAAKYDPHLSLTEAIENGASASLFFHFLSNQGYTDQRIHDMMGFSWVYDDFKKMEARMSSDWNIAEVWHIFATKFIDNEIKFKDDNVAMSAQPFLATELKFNPVNKIFRQSERLYPWDFSNYRKTRLPAQKVTEVSWVCKLEEQIHMDHTFLQYRRVGTRDWTTLREMDRAYLRTYDVQDAETVEYEFVVTSAGDPSVPGIYNLDLQYIDVEIVFYVVT